MKKPEIPIAFRFHAITIAATGIIGIPLLINTDASYINGFWNLVWAGFWGFGAGAAYQEIYRNADIEGKKVDMRLYKLTIKENKGNKE